VFGVRLLAAHRGQGRRADPEPVSLRSMIGLVVTFIGAGLMFLAVIASKLNKIDRQLAETDRLLSSDEETIGR
jgi:hypothetical protein